MTMQSKQIAICFAAVTGGTLLYQKLGDSAASLAIKKHLEMLSEAIVANNGRVVKTIGDGIMAAFPSAINAIDASRKMAVIVDTHPKISGIKLSVRIGIHYGHVLEQNGDFWGDGVNVAARLSGLAKDAEVFMSRDTADAIPQKMQRHLRDLSALSIKGKQFDLHVYQLLWRDSDDTTTISHKQSPAGTKLKLQLTISDKSFSFPDESGVMTLGRDPSADVQLRESSASRRHAKIERRGCAYYLSDESTNGTYLQIDGNREVLIRRDNTVLRQSGRISFGVSGEKSEESLYFSIS